jgi:hypothetical protein
MTEATDAALSLGTVGTSSVGEAAISPSATSMKPESMSFFRDSVSAVKTTLSPDLEIQTFGALGGSRHIELQANPCVFGNDCSAVFFDEVHDSIVTVQPSVGRKPGPSCAPLLNFVARDADPPSGNVISAKSVSSHEVLREFYDAESLLPVSVNSSFLSFFLSFFFLICTPQVRFSPSLIFACIVRSHEVAVVHNCNTQHSFNIQSKAARGNGIMGTVWIENDSYDLCVITTLGLEFHKFNSRADAMKLGKFYKFGVIHWYQYNHQLRALLICSGPRRYSPTDHF